MAHNYIYEVSYFPIHPGERSDAASVEISNRWFIGQRADRVTDVRDRDYAILALEQLEKAGRGISIREDENGKYLLVTSKENFFRPMWERFKKEMDSTVSLEKYMAYAKDDETHDVPYIFMDGVLDHLAAFVRSNECAENTPYYLGGVVDYHC